MWIGYDDKLAKDICYDCGSPVSKAAYNYFRRLLFMSKTDKSKIWSEILCKDDGTPIAMYFASQNKDHARLIEIAVRSSEQGKGVGKEVLMRLLSRMKANGLYKLTFRTPIAEDAQNFWLHIGARIVDVKGSDYEMELTIKQ